MAYIANRPVRFDRDYAIGETIPESVIDPKMTTKLVGMGRIIKVADAQGEKETAAESAQGEKETAAESAGEPQSDDNAEGGTNTHADEETAAEDESDGADGRKYVCEICGKEFKSANALAAHSRSHKK